MQARRVGVVILSGFLGLLVIEAGVRGAEWWSLAGPQVQRLHAQYKRIYSDERGTPHVFGHQPNVAVQLSRGAYTYTMVTNSKGLRESQDYDALDQSVIFLGDSIVEGSSVENRDTMDSVFEALTGVVALNFGLGAGNTVQEYHWLVSRYRPSYHAKLIILGFCLNDFEQNTYLRFFDPARGTWSFFKTVEPASGPGRRDPAVSTPPSFLERLKASLKTSRAFYTLYRALRAQTIGFPDWWSATGVKDDERAITESYLLKLQAFASDIGAELLVVPFPQESQLTRAYQPGERMQDVLIALCERHRIPFLDLYEPMKDAVLRQPDVDWYYDDTHPFTPGHRLIGAVLAERTPRMFPRLLRTRAPRVVTP